MKKYQVTILCSTGKYKPVSTIINVAETDDRMTIQKKGIQKICLTKRWDGKDLARYGYTKVKIRVYDKEKIEAENKARYEALKEAKYASGEWKRPKKDEKKA